MGNNIPKCMFCQKSETIGNPVLEVHSKGKRNGQLICFVCIKKKIKTLKNTNDFLIGETVLMLRRKVNQ